MGCSCGLARTRRTRNINRTVVPEPLGKLSRRQIHINYYKVMPALRCQVPSVMVTRETLRLKIPTPSFGLQTEISRHVWQWSMCEARPATLHSR